MVEQIDQAQMFEELRREDALRDQALKPGMPAVGTCYNCSAAIFNGGCFCDVDCRDDYEKRTKVQHGTN